MVRIKYASNALSEPSDEDSSSSSPSEELVPASKRRKDAAVRGQGSSGQGSRRDAQTVHVQLGGSLPPRRSQDKGKRQMKDKRPAKEKPSKSSRAARADNVDVVEGLKVHEPAYLEGYIYKDYKKDLDALIEARKQNPALVGEQEATDPRFYTWFQQDYYMSMLIDKNRKNRLASHQWIDWSYMESKKNHVFNEIIRVCKDRVVYDLMDFSYDWNEEVIC
ncbi:hypothetical protein QOZ80_3AG0221350 [Eleusine coracana subsp. coracana]|nr:hypothetical protein QOZ80_3AG0221350 [Eleusine coracana subsp. coracana]